MGSEENPATFREGLLYCINFELWEQAWLAHLSAIQNSCMLQVFGRLTADPEGEHNLFHRHFLLC